MTDAPKTIVAAVDGSDAMERTVGLAGALANSIGARLLLVYIISDDKSMASDLSGYDRDVSQDKLREGRREKAESVLDTAQQKAIEAGVQGIERRIETGHDPAHEIIKIVDQLESPMVVVGRRGLSTFGELLVGSVSHKLTHYCRCPVTVVT